MESALEVRYSGVVVGRGVPIRDREASGAFVVLAEPLPVGTRITLRREGGDEEARVTSVTESANPDLAGMRVELVVAEKKPPAAEPAPPAPAKPPVIEEPAARETPPVADAAASPMASEAAPAAAPAANDAAPAEVPQTDSTASAAHPHDHAPGQPQDPGLGGSGKRRRRRR